jgi:hypothetical protein
MLTAVNLVFGSYKQVHYPSCVAPGVHWPAFRPVLLSFAPVISSAKVTLPPGATHETLKILFQENPDVGDTFSAWKNKLWIAVRLPSGSCGEDQKP